MGLGCRTSESQYRQSSVGEDSLLTASAWSRAVARPGWRDDVPLVRVIASELLSGDFTAGTTVRASCCPDLVKLVKEQQRIYNLIVVTWLRVI